MEATDAIDTIDAAVRGFPWMDFELEMCSRWEALVAGAVDETAGAVLRIRFTDVAAVALPTEWKTDTSSVVFRLASKEVAVPFNKRLRIEQGYLVFEFVSEDHDVGACLIAAKSAELVRSAELSRSAEPSLQ